MTIFDEQIKGIFYCRHRLLWSSRSGYLFLLSGIWGGTQSPSHTFFCTTFVIFKEKIKTPVKITVSVRLPLKRRDTETALARGETLEKISKNMINDIEISHRGVDFSGRGSCVFQLFQENYDGSFELG